jgi:hypothetical protein
MSPGYVKVFATNKAAYGNAIHHVSIVLNLGTLLNFFQQSLSLFLISCSGEIEQLVEPAPSEPELCLGHDDVTKKHSYQHMSLQEHCQKDLQTVHTNNHLLWECHNIGVT